MNTSTDSPAATPLPGILLDRLRALLGADHVLSDPADCWTYAYDNSRLHAMPQLVVFARHHQQVRSIVALCNEYAVPLTCRGRGTATTGAAIPLRGGIVLSLERMDRILAIDPDNRLMRVEPGVLNKAVQDAAAEHGFFWPPDPTSAPYCSVGGNLACNAAGPRAVKYGTCRENTLALRAVTGNALDLSCGVQTSKGVVGYDLTRLLIGSEGTLAVITEATLKLTPIAEARRGMQAIYDGIEGAAAAIARIMAQSVTPSGLEFIDSAGLDLVRRHAQVNLPDDAGSLLMIEVDGPESSLIEAVRALRKACKGKGLLQFAVAESEEDTRELWAARKALSPLLRSLAPKKINEDVVVPVSRLPELITRLRSISEQYAIPIVNFGHAGNGNIHTNLLFDPDDPRQSENVEACLDAVFALVLKLEGTLSGEHGVGVAKRDFVSRELDPVAMDLMQRIRDQFDPQGILNPGKLFPAPGSS